MHASPSRFVDREDEIRELRELTAAAGPSIALLYGRRRVGKTYLLDRAWDEEDRFYFLASDTTPSRNRRELIHELGRWSGSPLAAEDYPTWRTVFRRLAQRARDRSLVVVLDEFQYLMGGDDDVVSQLVAVWDREVGEADLNLVLCGSAVGTMEQLRRGGSSLYGRIDWMARLGPFDYLDAAAMAPGLGRRDAARLFGIFGGVPSYLAAVEPGCRLDEEVVRTVLSPRGEVHLQLAHLLEQEQGIRDPGEYRAVLAAVAEGATETNEIAGKAGLQDRDHVVRRALETLEELELVRRERNFGAGPPAAWKNRIADPAVRFWYRFVEPARGRLATGDPAEVWADDVEPNLPSYMGGIFERVARQGFERHHRDWGWPAARKWARWEGQDRSRRSIEIDVVAELTDGMILTGEVKWSSRPVDVDVHLGLTRDLEDLARSGRAWAHRALDDGRSAGRIYLSAAGFTDGFRRRAAEEGRIRLLTLEDLYPARA